MGDDPPHRCCVGSLPRGNQGYVLGHVPDNIHGHTGIGWIPRRPKEQRGRLGCPSEHLHSKDRGEVRRRHGRLTSVHGDCSRSSL